MPYKVKEALPRWFRCSHFAHWMSMVPGLLYWMSMGITNLILGSGGADLEFPSPTKDSYFGAKE